MRTMKLPIWAALLLAFQSLGAAEIVEVLPVTDSILAVHFDDGWVDHYDALGESNLDDVPYRFPLDLGLASLPGSYGLVSSDDTNYANATSPIQVGRKSKGTEFSGNWNWTQPNQHAIKEHWVFLKLPHGLQRGKTYTLQTNNLASNLNSIAFVYDEFNLRSETIHCNQVGYAPQSEWKFAYVYAWLGDMDSLDLNAYTGTPFHIVDEGTGNIAFSGQLALRKRLGSSYESLSWSTYDPQEYYATSVWECDFSGFNAPGSYRLVVERIGCSFPFEIGNDVYALPFQVTARAMYHQRSGPERMQPYSAWPKPVDHMPGVNNFQVEYSNWRFMDGSDAFTELPANATGTYMPNAWGGWMDAVDFDRQNRHMLVSALWALTYEFAPEKFADGDQNIPESGNGLPDILDEAYWGIDLFRRLKGPTGGICGGLEANDHPASGQVSWTDTLNWYAYAEETQASYRLAGCAAHLAWCFELAGFSDSTAALKADAESAFAWANANLQAGDLPTVRSDRMYASAALYKLTGDSIYQRWFIEDHDSTSYPGNRLPENDDWLQLAAFTYLTTNRPDINSSVRAFLEAGTRALADFYTLPVANRACRFPGNYYVPTLIGLTTTTPSSFPLVAAYEILADSSYLKYIFSSADYTLGGNPLNMTWVTGLGHRSPQGPAQVDGSVDGVDSLIPGTVVYGAYTPLMLSQNDTSNLFNPAYGLVTTYPNDANDGWAPLEWPLHELYFDNRYSWLTSEYTVWQNTGPAAAVYGYLSKGISPPIMSGYPPPPPVNAEPRTENQLEVYPNPSKGRFYLSSTMPWKQLRVLDLEGKVLQHHENVQEASQFQLDLRGLPMGVYLLEIQSNAKKSTKKLVLQ